MAKVGTFSENSNSLVVVGIAGVADNSVVMEIDNPDRFNDFTIMSTAGAMDVAVSLDGTNFSTAPLSLEDCGGTTTTRVILTVANRIYRFRGFFRAIRVSQAGATAVANPSMTCGAF